MEMYTQSTLNLLMPTSITSRESRKEDAHSVATRVHTRFNNTCDETQDNLMKVYTHNSVDV